MEWKYIKGSGSNEIVDVNLATGSNLICEWEIDHRGRSDSPSDENGRLMALAPGLLLLCQRVADLSPSDHAFSIGYLIRQAREVVTKAKGELT